MRFEDDQVKIIVDRPVSKGGNGGGLMGGQYLLLGIGGCFCSTLFEASIAREITLEGLQVHIRAEISDSLPKRFSEVHLKVSYDTCSKPAEFQKLLQIAEKGCLSINTIKNGMGFSVEHS